MLFDFNHMKYLKKFFLKLNDFMNHYFPCTCRGKIRSRSLLYLNKKDKRYGKYYNK